MPKGHYLTHPSPSKTKEPSVLKTAPTATATTAGGAASAMSTSSATGSGQPQHPSITAIGKKPIARSFSPSQDRPVHVVESYHTSDMPKGHYLTHPSPFKTRKSVSHKAIPNFIPANNMRRSHVSSAVPAASVATTQAPTTSSTAIAAQPAGNSTLHNLAGGAAMGAPVALAVHNIDHMDHKNDNDSLPQSSDPAGSSSDHAVALKQQKDDPTLYPEEQGSYPREDQGQRNNIKDSPPHSLPLTSPSSGSMAVPIAAGTTAAALESAADVPTNHAPQPSTLQREHHLTAATLKKPVSDLSLYEEEEGAYPRGGDEGGLHENPSPAVHPIGATEEVQLDADKMNAHHDAHQSMTDKVMGTLHGLHMPAILGGGDGKDKGKEERMKKVHDHNEAADVATATAVVGVGAGIGAFAAGTTGMNKGVGAGIGALAAGAIAMNKSLVGRKTSSSIKASSAEEKMLPGPSSMDKPVTDSKAPSTVMASSSETSTSPSTSPSTAPLAGGIAEAADTPTMDRSAMGSMTSPTVKAPSTMLDARGGAAGPDAMNIIMVDSQAPLPAKSSSTKTSELPIASKMLGAGAGAADIAAELRARTPKPYETHGIHADMPAMDEDQPTLISARKVEPVAVIPPVDSVLVTDKATMTRSAGSAIPYTSATKTPDTHATAFGAMNGKYDASAGTSSYSASSSSSSTAAPLAAATAVIAAGAAHAATKRDDHGHKELDVQDNKTTEHSAPAIATESTDTGDAVKPTRTHVNKVAETAAAAIPTADYAAYVHKPHDEAEYDPDMYASTMDGPAAHKRDDHGHIVLEEYDHNRVDPTTTTHAAAPVIADDTTSEVSGLDHEMVDNEAPATATTSTTAGPVVKPTETDFGKAATIVAVTAIPVSAYATRAHEGKEKAEYDSDEQKETRAEQEDRIFVDKAPDAIATASPHKTDEDIVEMRTTTATMIMPEDEIEMFPESVGSTSKVPPAALIIDTIEETSWSSGDDVQMDPLTTVMVVEAAGSEGDEEVAAEGIMETKETDKETDETDIETVKKEKKPRVPIKTRISKVTAPAAAAITSAAVAYKERQPAMKKRPSLRIKEDDVHKPTVPIVSHQLTMTEDDVDEPVVPIVSHRLTLTEDDVDKPVPRLSAFPVLRLTEDDVDKPDPSTARYPVIPKVEPKLVSTSALKVANASRPMIPDQPVQGKDIKLPTMHMPKVPKVHMPEMNMPKVSKPKLPKMSKPKLPKITKPKLPKVHMPTITKRKSKVTPEPAPVSSVATTTTETTSATPVDAVAPAVAPLPIFAAGDKTEIADTAVAKDEPAMAPVAPMTEVAETTMPVAAPTPVVQEPVKPRMVEGPVKKPVIVAATAVPVAAAAATTHPSPPPTLPALPPSPPPVAQTPIPAPAPSPPAPAPSKTPTILSNVAAPPAGYTGSIPKVGEGESLIWVKKIYTTQQYFDPEDELDELGYRKDRDVSRYIMGAGGNRRSGNYSDTKNRGGPYTGGGKRVDYHPSNHTRPERYVDSPAPPQSANEYRQTTARK
ncbi:hypothetical protein BG011_005189 [Mortierella polycephala]|uniref:Uncharacterized protein n=1 Tax=Mortierella polycephala TaxID=41804 RepID=A0A9P6PYU0_9FUNG|nr:hypothetical protein BG011_005189 [Mortierella polycephala]